MAERPIIIWSKSCHCDGTSSTNQIRTALGDADHSWTLKVAVHFYPQPSCDLCGKPWLEEPFFRANTLVGFNKSAMWIAHDGIEVPTPLGEIFDGMVDYFKRTTNATFEVDHYWEAELVTDNPLLHVRLNDIAES